MWHIQINFSWNTYKSVTCLLYSFSFQALLNVSDVYVLSYIHIQYFIMYVLVLVFTLRGVCSNIQINIDTQTTRMIFLKIFVNLFTSILLVLLITMAIANHKLTKSGAVGIYSFHYWFKDHGNQEFDGFKQVFNNHYRVYMEEDVFNTIYVDPATKEYIKKDAVQIVNDWYWWKILEIWNHIDGLVEEIWWLLYSRKYIFVIFVRMGILWKSTILKILVTCSIITLWKEMIILKR